MNRLLAIGAVVALAALASPVRAHLALEYPPSRYGGDVLKQGPCGVSGGARGTMVTELASGSDVTVVWNEYIDHPGHFRIAFDADGDDDFRDPVCVADCATRTPEIGLYVNDAVLLDGIADTDGGESRVTVRLPDVECDRCTLQVIQVMTDKPPYTSPGNDIYYQCADLVLRHAAASCVGDCDGGGQVTVDELTLAVRIALGLTPAAACAAADRDGDGTVAVDEIVGAVAAALGGCAG